MRYVIFRSAGKQYKATEGDILNLEEKFEDKEKEVTFDDVLLYVSDGNIQIGTPKVTGVKVQGTVLGEIKGEKIRVSKFKAKARYRRVTGFRAKFSKVKIEKIISDSDKKETSTKEEEPKTRKKTTSKK